MIRLLYDQVAIRPDPPTERKHGMIVIPQTVDTAPDRGWIEEGTVVYAGPGDKYKEDWPDPNGNVRRRLITSGGVPVVVPPQCQPGDRVLYVAGRAGNWVEDNGERLYVIHCEQFVLAVLEPEAAAA